MAKREKRNLVTFFLKKMLLSLKKKDKCGTMYNVKYFNEKVVHLVNPNGHHIVRVLFNINIVW